MKRREALALLGFGAGLIPPVRANEARSVQRPRANLPAGAIIRTVLKDIRPDDLGAGHTLFHEHLSVRDLGLTVRNAAPRTPLDEDGRSDETIVDELRASARDGLRCIVDSGTGRRTDADIARLKKIATESGVHVVMAGGYYLAPYPAAVAALSEEELAGALVQDASTQGWGAIGEIGSSMEMQADERKMHRAAAKAHLRTGLPIFTHTPHEGCAKCGLDQLEIHTALGVKPEKLCIGHMAGLLEDPIATTHKLIAKQGAFVGIDAVGHFIPSVRPAGDYAKVRIVLALIDAGFEDHILFSSDLAHQDCLQRYWGAGYSTVSRVFVPKLRHAGVKEATIHKILVENSSRFLAYVPHAAA
jgi:phosphotriesterase-related protein